QDIEATTSTREVRLMSAPSDLARSDASVTCPRCQFSFSASDAARSDGAVTCPRCQFSFSVTQEAGHVTVSGGEACGRLEAAAPCLAADRVQRIGRFEIRRFLGEGAFGRVYQAFDPSLKRTVALKVAKPELMASESRVERFEREARAAAQLQHPHI